MDPIVHQLAERGIDGALAGDAAHADEGRTFDEQRKMTFPATVVSGVADVAVALVVELEAGRGKRCDEPLPNLDGNWTGCVGDALHPFYIAGG